MTKNEKLARNTIRVRRAQNKRKDEPNKPKPKQSRKRLISRIVALFGCLLLVSALVVPCFAAQPDNATMIFDEMRYNYGVGRDESYFERFGSDNYAFANFRNGYQSWFDYAEDYAVLSSGNVRNLSDFSLTDYSFGDISADSDGEHFEILVKDVDVYFYMASAVNSRVILDFLGRYCDIKIIFENYGVPLLEVYFYFDDEEILSIGYRADTESDIYSLSSIRCLGTDYYQPSTISTFSLVLGYQELLDLRFCADLSVLFFGNDKVVFPRQELRSFDEAWRSGKDQAVTLEQNAYDAGLADGSGDYDEGYRVGVTNGRLQMQYEIDSGEFGRNLLGNTFEAPFRAVTSIELVDWTLENGTNISITLGTVLSAFIGVTLFIWFLKMFAGG